MDNDSSPNIPKKPPTPQTPSGRLLKIPIAPTFAQKTVTWLKKLKMTLKYDPLAVFGLSNKSPIELADIREQGRIIFEDFIYIRLKEAAFGLEQNSDDDDDDDDVKDDQHGGCDDVRRSILERSISRKVREKTRKNSFLVSSSSLNISTKGGNLKLGKNKSMSGLSAGNIIGNNAKLPTGFSNGFRSEFGSLPTPTTSGDSDGPIKKSIWQLGAGSEFENWHNSHVTTLCDVSREMHAIGLKLETMYPSLYKNVSGRAHTNIRNESQCRKLVTSFGDFMFKNGVVTWGRIVAMFVLSSSLIVECCQNGDFRFIKTVMAAHSEVLEKHVINWIAEQGGWGILTKTFREVTQETRTLWALLGLGASVGFAVMWVAMEQL
ncbi:hypothetical protein HELRODRAFT_183772 [Helobdella robusta]|uniref:Bcl-2 Bcl-2 homology region 1-3 domain-containing protein n=1 Tax=Helobdella robusta TaxID=6412 RepID=T1FK63_HELRO|nr:hypothetical protein HELRODRAFT_183772 [Helobdella robusta]ESO10306.1 hypothetical protein HELRODRAFT_183772 [Helobdella robusta]